MSSSSTRVLRVNELIQRELSNLLRRRYKDDSAPITITAVEVTPDTRQGKVFVSITGDEEQTEEQGTRVKDSDTIARGFGKYQWKLSETSAFAQALKVESGAVNTYLESVTELKLSIVGNLFATLAYTVKNNSVVPTGTEHTDTLSAVALTWQFGRKP